MLESIIWGFSTSGYDKKYKYKFPDMFLYFQVGQTAVVQQYNCETMDDNSVLYVDLQISKSFVIFYL
jgi:hypothetical protein